MLVVAPKEKHDVQAIAADDCRGMGAILERGAPTAVCVFQSTKKHERQLFIVHHAISSDGCQMAGRRVRVVLARLVRFFFCHGRRP